MTLENIIQFTKYALGGFLATIAHIVIFHLLAWKGFAALENSDWFVKLFKIKINLVDTATRSRNAMIDNGIGFIFSNFIAYLINITWVFNRGKHSWIVEISLFYLVSGISLIIGTWLMGWLIKKFSMRTTYAFGANAVTAVMINYAMRKFFIFAG